MSKSSNAPSKRARVSRLHERGRYDADTIHAILDAMPMCTVGHVVDGQPIVTPTLQWRVGGRVFWHGSSAGQMGRAGAPKPVCLTVAILDGLVLGRSAFEHSANYRSVMIFGVPERVESPEEKTTALRAMIDGLFPGRWKDVRAPSQQELKATAVFSMPISEASAKIRSGPPGEDRGVSEQRVWTGVLPIGMDMGAPVPDQAGPEPVAPPDYLTHLKIGGR